MKLAVIFLSALVSVALWFAAQQATPFFVCRGKSLPITMLPLPGRKATGISLPLRFGGTREVPRLQVRSEKASRLVFKNRDEFSQFWKQLNAGVSPDSWPPLPEVDFTKDMVVVSVMGTRPYSGYWTIIDGACEADGQVEVFVSNVEDTACSGVLTSLTYPADAVLLPRTDLPIVFRETQVSCTEWHNLIKRAK